MSISAVQVPAQTRGASKRHFTDDELKQADVMLKKGEPVSDGVLYDAPQGKMDARTRAQYAAWYLRTELALVLHPDDDAARAVFLRSVRGRTWPDSKGFRWAVVPK